MEQADPLLGDSSRGATKYFFQMLLLLKEQIQILYNLLIHLLRFRWKFNQSSDTFVAWNWKANGGTTSSNTDGGITSTVQVNSTAGFSIVTWTGMELKQT